VALFDNNQFCPTFVNQVNNKLDHWFPKWAPAPPWGRWLQTGQLGDAESKLR